MHKSARPYCGAAATMSAEQPDSNFLKLSSSDAPTSRRLGVWKLRGFVRVAELRVYGLGLCRTDTNMKVWSIGKKRRGRRTFAIGHGIWFGGRA